MLHVVVLYEIRYVINGRIYRILKKNCNPLPDFVCIRDHRVVIALEIRVSSVNFAGWQKISLL